MSRFLWFTVYNARPNQHHCYVQISTTPIRLVLIQPILYISCQQLQQVHPLVIDVNVTTYKQSF